MYTLYFSPGACSLAIHTILNLIDQKPELVYAGSVANFESINRNKMVPVLKDEQSYLTEGAAIILHLLNKHENELLPESGGLRQKAIENIMMANATMHPAYGRLFFVSQNMEEGEQKEALLQQASHAINALWETIETKIANGPFLGGLSVSPADILLAVYSRWGAFFPVDIKLGPKTQEMVRLVTESNEFKLALQRETDEHAKHAA